jgi:chromosome segregation ATPase
MNDFSQVLKLMLEMPAPAAPSPDPAAPPAGAPAPAPEMAKKHLDTMLSELQAGLTRAFKVFKAGMADLDKRMAEKMTAMTSAAGSLGATVEELNARVEQLTQDYEAKAAQVDEILAKVEKVMPGVKGAGEVEQRVEAIVQGLAKLKQELREKGNEAKELQRSLKDTRAQAHADMEALQQQLFALDDFAQEAEQKLQAARQEIERLETEKGQFTRGVSVEKDALNLQRAHTENKPYGGFDFMEHLRRAHAKDKKKYGEW